MAQVTPGSPAPSIVLILELCYPHVTLQGMTNDDRSAAAEVADAELIRLPGPFDRVDRVIAQFLARYGVRTMRYALAFIFILFGILKPLGISPAEQIVLDTVSWIPLVSPRVMLHVIGWWEVTIGLCFLWRPLIRVAIALLAMQMVGTFLPLVLLPETCWAIKSARIGSGELRVPAPTTEAQYIIKNLLIIGGAMIVGGTVRQADHETPVRL